MCISPIVLVWVDDNSTRKARLAGPSAQYESRGIGHYIELVYLTQCRVNPVELVMDPVYCKVHYKRGSASTARVKGL